jgi:hypothetical protein
VNSGKSNSKPAIGFLTVIDHPQHGLFGGYLVLNFAGRPLEFHCTAPIKPNRAQQILYGPTLDSFLYGEQIGSTLLGHAKTSPRLICTDCEPVLSLRDLIDLPVALVLPPEESQGGTGNGPAAEDKPALRVDAPHSRGPRLIIFELGRNRLAVSQQKGDDRKQLSERLGEAAAGLDLWEPFTRIREAIEEAQQAAR